MWVLAECLGYSQNPRTETLEGASTRKLPLSAPPTSSPLWGYHETASHHLLGSAEIWAFWTSVLRIKLPHIQPLCRSLELALQQQGTPRLMLLRFGSFCFSVILFGVRTKTMGSWHLMLIFFPPLLQVIKSLNLKVTHIFTSKMNQALTWPCFVGAWQSQIKKFILHHENKRSPSQHWINEVLVLSPGSYLVFQPLEPIPSPQPPPYIFTRAPIIFIT